MPAPAWSKLDSSQILPAAFDEANGKLRVDASVSVGTTEVIIDHANDSIKIGDGVDFLSINADGSINVNATFADPVNEDAVSTYNEVLSVASSTETTVVTYTVPALTDFFLHRIEASGTNIAEWRVKKNGSVIAKKYTNFGDSLNADFDFTSGPRRGYQFAPADVITVTVLHLRPYVGNFNARVQGLEKT